MNGDNSINILDLSYVGSKSSSTDALTNVNDDAVADILDLAWLANQFD